MAEILQFPPRLPSTFDDAAADIWSRRAAEDPEETPASFVLGLVLLFASLCVVMGIAAAGAWWLL